MYAVKIATTGSDNEDSRFIDSNLRENVNISAKERTTKDSTYRMLDSLLDLAYRQLHGQADGFLIRSVLLNNLLKYLSRLLMVLPSFNCGMARNLRILVYDSKTNNFVSILHQFIHKPFESNVRVLVSVDAGKERSASTGQLEAFMFKIQG